MSRRLEVCAPKVSTQSQARLDPMSNVPGVMLRRCWLLDLISVLPTRTWGPGAPHRY